MLKRLIAMPAFVLAATLSMPAQSQDASTVVATVNGVDITLGHMIIARATLPQQYQQLPDEVLFQGILDQLIQQTVLSQSFEGSLPARVSISLENEERSLTAGEVVEGILQNAVSEEAVKELYNTTYVDQDPGKEFNASHILVESEDEAKAIIEEISGGADFAAVAREKSTGPSGPNGGSLGWFGPGMMVPPFEAAVMALDVGQVSEPVETQFGWHVIKLNETRVPNVPALDEVRSELEQQVRETAVSERIAELVEGAEIDRTGANSVPASLILDMTLVE